MTLGLPGGGVSILSKGWIPLAGTLLCAALIPLLRHPTLIGAGVVPFLVSFCAAGLAYLLALSRLEREEPSMGWIWGFAVVFRLVMLLTPVTLSEDVYRYVWDGHLLSQGINPYAHPVDSPLLDAYDTPLREQVAFPWMATPYLPAAEAYFALVAVIAPQSPFAFQASAALLDLSAGAMLLLALRRLSIPPKAILVYLWNPLVIVEFAHGAHVDALMVFFLAAGVWGLARGGRAGLTISAVAVAAAVLVKGWPLLAAPVFFRRWGWKRVLLFGMCVALPLVLFAAGAGWGLGGSVDGRGVFGTLGIYVVGWKYNSGLFQAIALLFPPATARLIAIALPGLLGLLLGGVAWFKDGERLADPAGGDRDLVRLAAAPLGLFLVLAPAVFPWYLTLMLALLPFFWPSSAADSAARRWFWPWIYFMFFEAFTYLAFSGGETPVQPPRLLSLVQLAGYLPFWVLLAWAGWPAGKRIVLDFSRAIHKNHSKYSGNPSR